MATIVLWAVLVLSLLTFIANVTALAVVLRRDRRPRYPTNVRKGKR